MVIASHVIFTGYGFWLPNDPRGSWSDSVRSWEILRAGGAATKINERRSVADRAHDAVARRAAKAALRYPPVRFDGVQALAVAKGFAQAIDESDYSVYACAIMPDHMHLVAGRHAHDARRIAGHLKTRATQKLAAAGLHPMRGLTRPPLPSPWVRNCWKVYLDTHGDVRRAVDYVRANPTKLGFKAQHWSFVIGFGD
jgi:REP element-mobilizing transposase RayT